MGELLKQWDDQRNALLTPEQVSYGSKRKIWWCCEKGHEWRAAVYTRTGSGTHCPVCAGRTAQAGENDLGTCCPELAKQWHPVKNAPLTPEQVLPGSHKMVWWI
nr:zinc-ribbon domain-containing protein [Flavonifractor sp. AGMB03687]